MTRQHVVHVQARVMGSEKLIRHLRESGFKCYLVNIATGEYESLENGVTAIKARSVTADQHYFADCLYNDSNSFPPQETMRMISLHPKVTYIGISRGDITSVT